MIIVCLSNLVFLKKIDFLYFKKHILKYNTFIIYMDISNITSNNQILTDLDKMIRIKHYREKNKNKTCVYGISDFVPAKDLDALVKLIRKRLGCSGNLVEEVGTIQLNEKTKKASPVINKVLVFSGNHIEGIKNFLLEKKIVDNNHIKI